MVTEGLFVALVVVVALQRVAEVVTSRRNEARLLAKGGRRHAEHQMSWMRLLHGAWLVAMPVEVILAERRLVAPVAVIALMVFAVGQWLRYRARKALGPRWTVSVVTVPGEEVVSEGIFRKIRHPNYLGVVLEIGALPLVHGAWVTALVASTLNALLLRWRIHAEERALRSDTDYEQAFGEEEAVIGRVHHEES